MGTILLVHYQHFKFIQCDLLIKKIPLNIVHSHFFKMDVFWLWKVLLNYSCDVIAIATVVKGGKNIIELQDFPRIIHKCHGFLFVTGKGLIGHKFGVLCWKVWIMMKDICQLVEG